MNSIIQKIKKIGNTWVLLLYSFLVMGVVTLFRFTVLPPQIPLYYSRPIGEEQIVDTIFILLIPILTLLTVVINSYIWKRYFSDNNFIKHILYYVNILVIIIFTIVFLRIILLVS